MEALEIARDVFAVIGALGTVGALVWRVYTWRHGHHPHVEVRIANGFPTYGPNAERLGEWCFTVTAINRGDHPVHVASAGLTFPNRDDRDLVIVAPPFPGALPATVQPRDSGQTWVERTAVEAAGMALEETPMVGWVRLSTDERFESKPAVLAASA